LASCTAGGARLAPRRARAKSKPAISANSRKVEYEPRRIRGGSASRIFWALLRGGNEVRPWVLLREALHLRTMEDAEHDDVCVIEAIEDPITIFRFDENIHARLVGALAETREVSKACNRRSEVCDDIAFTDG